MVILSVYRIFVIVVSITKSLSLDVWWEAYVMPSSGLVLFDIKEQVSGLKNP